MAIETKKVTMYDKEEIYVYTLTNTKGMKAEITNYGGIVISLFVPDRNGNFEDVVLGYEDIKSYYEDDKYLGAVIGRYANRIEDSVIEINGNVYNLEKNEGNNHLHGGSKGFHKVVWKGEVIKNQNGEVLSLSYQSKDGEGNYPGNLEVKVTYSLTEENGFVIDYYGISDKDTVLNLTNHAYFNLSGHGAGNISEHLIMINADSYTPVNKYCIPTGQISSVSGTPFDFTKAKKISDEIDSGHEQIVLGNGYDHNWVLNTTNIDTVCAKAIDPKSGRTMDVYTTKPGIQFYSGNSLLCEDKGKGGVFYKNRYGFCLETQFFPNSVKITEFPSPLLKSGVPYKHRTEYRFSVI